MSAPKLIATDEPETAKPEAAKPEAAKPEAAKPEAAKPEEPALPAVPKSALELRRARRRILQRRFGIWVGLPTLIAFVYYLLIATPQYDAWFLVAVESSEGRVTDATGKGPNAGNLRDARLLREALRGTPALAALDQNGAFRTHYRNNGDWLSRLDNDSGNDSTFAYFRDKITATHEAGTNISTIRVRAFSGAAAHDFAEKLVAFAQAWVVQQNESSSAARLKQAQAEITRERTRLATTAAALAKVDQPKPTDPVAIEHQVAEKRLEAALKGFQEAQLEVGRAQRYLVTLSEPSRPDTAALPRRAWGILSVFIGALVLVSVLSLLGASVREHAKF